MTETRFSEVRYREDANKAAAHYDGVTPLSGDDLADVIFYTTMLPAHVNINTLQVTLFAWHRRVARSIADHDRNHHHRRNSLKSIQGA